MKVFIETYGCQMNVADSELIMALLEKDNIKCTDDITDADVLIFNTCSVRQHAEARVLGRISNEMSRKRTNPHLKIGVIGCMAQRLGEKLVKINPAIDFVIGVDQYDKLPAIIRQITEGKDFLIETEIDSKQMYNDIYPEHQGNFNAFVTIMRGCNNFCTYCIVPYTRGRERSRPLPEILTEVKSLGAQGFKDITLLGQNVNSYNYNEINFSELLRKVNEIDTIRRIRFVTSHPKDLSAEVIEVIAESDKVCEHLHLGLQSGDDEILRRMNRGYQAADFLKLVRDLRKAIPEIAITTDIIAGFPGETEQQFQHTVDLMKEICFDYAFTFKFSPREGTAAASLPGQLSRELRQDRLQRLINLQEEITTRKYQAQIGRVKEIYVERLSKKSDNEVSGKSRDFKITVFPGNEVLLGKFVKVKIIQATGWTLKGKLLD